MLFQILNMLLSLLFSCIQPNKRGSHHGLSYLRNFISFWLIYGLNNCWLDQDWKGTGHFNFSFNILKIWTLWKLNESNILLSLRWTLNCRARHFFFTFLNFLNKFIVNYNFFLFCFLSFKKSKGIWKSIFCTHGHFLFCLFLLVSPLA